MPTLDATVGGAAANSYVTVADADTIMDERLHATAWTGATADNKARALIWATRLLDALRWQGDAATDTQRLRWPRDGVYDLEGDEIGDTVIPQWLKDATAEYALILIGADRTVDSDSQGIDSIKVDTLEIAFNYSKPGTIPPNVRRIIEPYLVAGGSVLLERV